MTRFDEWNAIVHFMNNMSDGKPLDMLKYVLGSHPHPSNYNSHQDYDMFSRESLLKPII